MKETEDKYTEFYRNIRQFIPEERIKKDRLNRLAWGTDAGFYRLVPRIVVFPENPDEVSRLLQLANRRQIPVTFRAAGTSLSGQSISDSVLIVAGKKWDGYRLSDDKTEITLQPGITGGRINEILKPSGRKFSPDPASVKSAMAGGIIINNASGMNCGTHANSDKVIRSVRIVMSDGFILDTGNPQSRDEFTHRYPEFIRELDRIRSEVINDRELTQRIRRKYEIKNVTGLNLLPLIRFENPFDLITHLMVGSEGTLAFLAEATVSTAKEQPCKASAMVYFNNIVTACKAVQALKKTPVASAEMLDRKALHAVEGQPGIPAYLKDFDEEATALLLETQAENPRRLDEQIAEITRLLENFETLRPVNFTDKEEEYGTLWAIRSGIFPSVGGMREPGTTTLIEDVAFHLENLPEATAGLQQIIARYNYHDGVIYGHALEGNFHFILNQRFDVAAEVERYEALINDVIGLVVDKYDGSLKAEHGTGRNMAPFVEREWGAKAFRIMKDIKRLFDPQGILNPGVIFNDDPRCHLRHFKPLPLTNPQVDKCIECGFCEINCVTAGLTLSSRQRIVIRREISRLGKTGENPRLQQELETGYRYAGEATCAGDGLCATSCPMGINTGNLTHDLRRQQMPAGSPGWKAGRFAAGHFAGIKGGLRSLLYIADDVHAIVGTKLMSAIAGGLRRVSGNTIPLWTPAMPKAHKIRKKRIEQAKSPLKVVYFPSCINQTMGVPKNREHLLPLSTVMINLLNKSGYEVIFPENMENLCCGTIWESKGMPDIADRKTGELEDALWIASAHGKYPVLCDQSPCLYRMREKINRMQLFEPVEFIERFLVDKLDFTPIDGPVAVHTTCSMTKMNLRKELATLARRCARTVVVPEEVGCCAFAGDKGFTHPEVNRYALRKLRPQLEKAGVERGYSNSRTCEIGLTVNGGIPYLSIVYLVDQCTLPKTSAGKVLKTIDKEISG